MRVRLVDNRTVKRDDVTATVPRVAQTHEERVRAACEELEREARARIDGELADAKASAEIILKESHEQATKLLEHARAEACAITETATRNGEAAAAEAARHAAEEARAALSAAWLSLRDLEARSADRQLDRLARLAGVVAERVIGRALELKPDLVVSLAERALRELQDARRVRLEAHPHDAEQLREALAAGGLGERTGAVVDVVDGGAVERGSFRMHTDLGSVGADLHVRVERLALALRDAMKRTS